MRKGLNSEMLSKVVSHALRHEPELYELRLGDDGWVSVFELWTAIKNKDVQFADLQEVDIYEMVLSAKKLRHEIKGGMIKAIYGHSAKVNIGYSSEMPPVELYHGTSKESALKILSVGLSSMNRLYVHLSSNKETAHLVGLRKTKHPIILKIKADEASSKQGIKFYPANKDTWLTEFVPPDFIAKDQ